MIYATDDRLFDDDSVLQFSTKTGTKWKAIKDLLINKYEKIFIEDGFIRQKICTEKLEKSWSKIGQASDAGKASAEKRKLLKLKDTGSTGVEFPLAKNPEKTSTERQLTKDPITKKERKKEESLVKTPQEARQKMAPEISAPEVQMAISLYNQIAKEIGLPVVVKMTPTRSAALKARLKDTGGLSGWEKYLEMLREATFLTGKNDSGWVANFDFITREQSFIKICEGSYRERKTQNAQPTRLTRSEQNEITRREVLESYERQEQGEDT